MTEQRPTLAAWAKGTGSSFRNFHILCQGKTMVITNGKEETGKYYRRLLYRKVRISICLGFMHKFFAEFCVPVFNLFCLECRAKQGDSVLSLALAHFF